MKPRYARTPWPSNTPARTIPVILREGITRRAVVETRRLSLPTPDDYAWRTLVSQAEDEVHYRLNNIRAMPVRDSLRPGDVLREDERDPRQRKLPDGTFVTIDTRSSWAGSITDVDVNGQNAIERIAEARLDLDAVKMMAQSLGFPFRPSSLTPAGIAWLVASRKGRRFVLVTLAGERRTVVP